MTDRNEIERIVRASYDARRRNDVDATLKHFHPDARFRISGSPALGPMTKPTVGHGDLRQMFEQLFPQWDWKDFHVTNIHVEGDTAYVHLAGKIRYIPTGKVIETEILDRLILKEGLIVEFTEFLDTHLAVATMQP